MINYTFKTGINSLYCQGTHLLPTKVVNYSLPPPAAHCSSNTCHGNGTCYESNSKLGYFCDCNIGYFGPFCNFTVTKCLEEALETNDEVCSGHGYCVEIAGEARCECDASYVFTGKVVNTCIPKFFCPNCVNGTGMCIEPVGNEGNVIEGICSCYPGRH